MLRPLQACDISSIYSPTYLLRTITTSPENTMTTKKENPHQPKVTFAGITQLHYGAMQVNYWIVGLTNIGPGVVEASQVVAERGQSNEEKIVEAENNLKHSFHRLAEFLEENPNLHLRPRR